MTNPVLLNAARCAAARAHLAGAEAAELEAKWMALLKPAYVPYDQLWEAGRLRHLAAAARRRYWREIASASRLSGQGWPEAEALGVEP